jgi:hypothetical protein
MAWRGQRLPDRRHFSVVMPASVSAFGRSWSGSTLWSIRDVPASAASSSMSARRAGHVAARGRVPGRPFAKRCSSIRRSKESPRRG